MSTSEGSGGTGGGGGAPPPGGGGISSTGSNVVVCAATSTTGVPAKISHVKTTTIDAGIGNLGMGSALQTGITGAIMTGGGGGGGVSVGTINTAQGGIKVSTGSVGIGSVVTSMSGTPIALSTSQSTTATAIRAIGAGGQSTQVRVVMPTGIMPPSMIKQLENAASAGRTQITAIPAAAARSVSSTSITVTRPVTQTTYLPRAGISGTQMTAGTIGVPTVAQRLVTPIRATPTSGTVGPGGATVTGLTPAGNFVRGTTVGRNSSSPATTVISPANSATWMAANTTGQVQLIRAIPHQSRQRIITTQGIGAAGAGAGGAGIGCGVGTAVSGTVVATPTATSQQSAVMAQAQQHQQNQGVPSTIQAVSSQSIVHNQQQQQQQQQQAQQTYVATLAAVLPPRQHQATLVYSSNVPPTSQPLSQAQQFNPAVATGQRFAVATPISATTGTVGSGPRQIRPIPLGKSFSAAKLNTTSISIRAPNIPQLTPALATGGVASGATVLAGGGANSPRSTTTIAGVTGSTTNVIPTTNLSTTRIIQLQQQPGGTTQQIIGSTGRLASSVMLQPIIVNASGTSKFGFRPPVTMAAKVQPSLTITQLGIGKLPSATASSLGGGNTISSIGQQNISAANIQTLSGNTSVIGGGNSASSIASSASATSSSGVASITASNLVSNAAGGTTQMVNVSQGGQLLTAQNIVSSAGGGATVVPLAITTRGGATGNILTGTITPIKNANAITVGKVMTQAQVAGPGAEGNLPTNVYIHHAPAPQQQQSHNSTGVGMSGGTVVTSNALVNSRSNVSVGGGTTGNAILTAAGTSNAGAFLPPGSTIYYESVPASSVQVSTGVLSLTTTSVTSSTMSQNQAASSVASNLATISTMPFSSHGGNSTATFTVVPSSGAGGGTGAGIVGARTIGQLQIPVSSATGGGAQIQAVPVRFSAQLTAGSNMMANTDATQTLSVAQNNAVANSAATAQLVQANVSNSGQQQQQQQILIPASSHHQGVAAALNAQPGQHMIIPLQTSIKVTTGNAAATGGNTVVTNFLRKRDADGSPIRAAKNLGPTLLSMGSSIINATGSPAPSSVGSSYSIASGTSSSSSNVSALTTEALAKKDRAAAATAAATSSVSSTRTTRADSPASSDGSTTVSANSSPGVEQQMQDGNMLMNRLSSTNEATHFNPINELYSNHHHSMSVQHQISGTTAMNSRNSQLEHQHQQFHGTSNTQRLNGGPIDCPPRKKSRRSTNDSQQSIQSQASLTLPPPAGIVGSASTNSMQHSSSTDSASLSITGSNGLLMSGGGSGGPSSQESNNSGTNNIIHKTNNVPPTAGNKENAKPMEFVLRKPRNCTLLNAWKQSWKAANNHFQRYSDVKPREERRPTVIDLANQANVLGKINGWKVHHLRSQMEDLCENETLSYDKLSKMLVQMESHGNNPEIERISDLLKGNMQRSKIIVDGVNEAQNQIMKIFEHKSHISDIINRCASKRNFKKRDKV